MFNGRKRPSATALPRSIPYSIDNNNSSYIKTQLASLEPVILGAQTLLDSNENISETTKTIINLMLTGLITSRDTLKQLAPAQDVIGAEELERQRSVVLVGLPESTAKLPSERIKDDRVEVTKLFDALGIEAEPVSTYRLGGPQTQAGKGPRLVKILLPTRQFQWRMLGQWKHCRTEIQKNSTFQPFITNRSDPSKKRGGGVSILIKNPIPARQILSHSNSSFELLIVDLFLKPQLRLFCIYRLPNCSTIHTQSLTDLIYKYATTNSILCGDLNAPKADWLNFTSSTPNDIVY
jgi:hypothetical protein